MEIKPPWLRPPIRIIIYSGLMWTLGTLSVSCFKKASKPSSVDGMSQPNSKNNLILAEPKNKAEFVKQFRHLRSEQMTWSAFIHRSRGVGAKSVSIDEPRLLLLFQPKVGEAITWKATDADPFPVEFGVFALDRARPWKIEAIFASPQIDGSFRWNFVSLDLDKSPVSSSLNPNSCQGCHWGRPIWDPYPFWQGTYGHGRRFSDLDGGDLDGVDLFDGALRAEEEQKKRLKKSVEYFALLHNDWYDIFLEEWRKVDPNKFARDLETQNGYINRFFDRIENSRLQAILKEGDSSKVGKEDRRVLSDKSHRLVHSYCESYLNQFVENVSKDFLSFLPKDVKLDFSVPIKNHYLPACSLKDEAFSKHLSINTILVESQAPVDLDACLGINRERRFKLDDQFISMSEIVEQFPILCFGTGRFSAEGKLLPALYPFNDGFGSAKVADRLIKDFSSIIGPFKYGL